MEPRVGTGFSIMSSFHVVGIDSKFYHFPSVYLKNILRKFSGICYYFENNHLPNILPKLNLCHHLLHLFTFCKVTYPATSLILLEF